MKNTNSIWRPMALSDLDAVMRLADRVHPGLPEDRTVFAERITLYPAGCRVLDVQADNADAPEIMGYIISHPAPRFSPPALDSLLTAIPDSSENYYIHDVVMAPECRGGGLADAGIRAILAGAQDFETVSLVSVYGTASFWARYGFTPLPENEAEKVRSHVAAYGDGAVFMLRDNRSDRI